MKFQRFIFHFLSSVQLYGFIFCILKKYLCVLYPSVLCLFNFSVWEINEPLNLLCKCFIMYKLILTLDELTQIDGWQLLNVL